MSPLDSWERHEIDAARPWTAIFITSGDLNGDHQEDIIVSSAQTTVEIPFDIECDIVVSINR